MVDAHALGACGLGRAGSNPASPTMTYWSVTVPDGRRGKRDGFTQSYPALWRFCLSGARHVQRRIINLDIEGIKTRTIRAISPLKSTSAPCFFGTRTDAGRSLPDYYLVYFTLVDLLGFRYVGRGEKVAWSIPVDFEGRVYVIEHRKLGLGVFSSGGIDREEDAKAIVQLVKRGVNAARPYFERRADQALKGPKVNVHNDSVDLFDRYEFFLGMFETKRNKTGKKRSAGSYRFARETEWLAISAIESFFSWTEHVFIHLAILQGKCTTGNQVDQLAANEWKDKFKAALDVQDLETKRYYDDLLEIRRQVRNFVAHGSFGKNGEAFKFHSAAGAVPVMLPHRRVNRSDRFPDADAIKTINDFIEYLRSGRLSPAWMFLDSHLDTILTEAQSGTYDDAMASEDSMRSFIEYREYLEDMHANMDF